MDADMIEEAEVEETAATVLLLIVPRNLALHICRFLVLIVCYKLEVLLGVLWLDLDCSRRTVGSDDISRQGRKRYD